MARARRGTTQTAPERLIQFDVEMIGEKYLEGYLAVAAENIESSLMSVGATPGKDYTYIDLYKLAIQLVTAGPMESLTLKHKCIDYPLARRRV
jgi:hypothetical protein